MIIGVAIGVILGVTGLAALEAHAAKAAAKKKRYIAVSPGMMPGLIPTGPAKKGTTPEQLTFVKDILVKMALRQPVTAAERTQAYNIAMAAGIAKTAQAIKSESRLPLDEKWPGTDMSVLDMIKAALGL